jgi:hypothetical protein
MYVVPTAGSLAPGEVPGGRLAPQTTRLLLDLETEQTDGRLRDQLQLLLARNIEASGSVERGDAEPAIFAAAALREVDLVAMATRGMAGLEALWANDLVSRISADYDGALLLFPAQEK